MLSRVADNLYWFGRYLQRAENTARFANVHGHLILDLPRQVEFGWLPLVQILGAESGFHDRYNGDASEATVMRFLLLDEDHPGSIIASLQRAREILRSVRECTPREIWERLNDLHYRLQEHGEAALARSRRQELLQRIVDDSLLIQGIVAANMTRDVGYHFLAVGSTLEQADMTTRIIEVRAANLLGAGAAPERVPFHNLQWMGMLRSLMGHQMFRRHARGRVTGPNVLRFLLQNRDFPRSVMYALNRLDGILPRLPPDRRPQRRLDRVRGLVMHADVEFLMEGRLGEFLDEVQIGLAEVNEALDLAYFRL